tara:strand:+ start:1152 stop:1706 length:555 start_codon:yes stop_codon:yes gene_type:complete
MPAAVIKEGPAKGLTAKAEKFAQEIARGGKTLSDAYRVAYNAEKVRPSQVNERASRLMASPKIMARVQELQLPVRVATAMTLESHLNDLLALRDLATAQGQQAAAITAEIARAKAAGIVSDRLKVDHSGTVTHNIVPLRADELRGRIRGVTIQGEAQRITAPGNVSQSGVTLGVTGNAALHKLQ